MLDELDRRAAEIVGELARGDALLRAARPETLALSSVRWNLARTIRAYQLAKRQMVFDPLAASPDTEIAAEADRLRANCQRAADDGKAFILAWSGREGTEWLAYSAATMAMNARIRIHLGEERRLIAALLARAAATSAAA